MREINVARAIILNENNEVLLGKRAKGVGAGLMELPGGKVDHGETPAIAVVREVKEELGVEFSPHGLFREYGEKGEGDIIWKNSIFYGTAKGELKLDTQEVVSARYVTLEEVILFEMAFNQKTHLLDFFDKKGNRKI